MVNKVNHYDAVYKLVENNVEMFKGIEPYNVSIPPGWFNLISTLIDSLNEELKKCPQITLSIKQIKEKFGGLRFYYGLKNHQKHEEVVENIFKIVSKAENDSFGICYVCGEPATKRMSGWVSMRCDAHANENQVYDEDDGKSFRDFEIRMLKLVDYQ